MDSIKLIILFVLALAGGILYRMGGASGYNTKFRDLGIPTVGIILLTILNYPTHINLCYMVTNVVTFGLMFASQTTYFKKKGTEAKWWNWALVGLANGLALLPWALYSGLWIEWGIRTIGLVALITIWSEIIDNVVWEEFGRGFIIIASLGLFLRR